MKILAVMCYFPFPMQVGSSILACNHIRELSKKHSIHAVCLGTSSETRTDPEYIKELEVIPVEKAHRYIKLLQRVFYMFLGIPTDVTAVRCTALKNRVRELVEKGNFDAVLLYDGNAMQYCPPQAYKKAIVNADDPQSVKLKRMSRLAIWPLWKKIKMFMDALIMERYENKLFPQMAKVLYVSEADIRDKQALVSYNNIRHIIYGIKKEPDDKFIPFEARTEGMIVFSGNMHHPPNVEGALVFLQTTFKEVLNHYPQAVFWIVGANPDPRLFEAAKSFKDRVVITGRVDDMSDYLRRAKVSICPITLKIGCLTKILEAFTCGTPVVTTSAVNAGIGAEPGRDLWVEDQPGDFASRVVSLLKGEDWERFSKAGREFIEKKYSWELSFRQIEQYLSEIR